MAEEKRIYYGWFIVLSSFFTLFMASAAWTSFGIFIKPILEEYNWTRASISFAVSINMFVYGLGQPIVGWAVDRFGSKLIISTGILLLSIGVTILGRIENLWQLYFIYGILVSIAMSCTSHMSHYVLISNWFMKKRGTALGIITGGGSAGRLILIPLFMYLILVLGWRNTYQIIGISMLITVLPIFFFVIKNTPKEKGLRRYGDDSPNPDGVVITAIRTQSLHTGMDRTLGYAIKTSPFWLLSAGFFVCGFTWQIIITHMAPFATDIGFSSMIAANALGLSGGANFIGTLTMGAVSDKFGRKKPLALMYLIRGLALLIIILNQSLIALYIFAIVSGFTLLATLPLTSALIGEHFGIKNMGKIFGTVTMVHQIGSAISVYLGGFIFDIRGSYKLAYTISAILAIMASIAIISIPSNRSNKRGL